MIIHLLYITVRVNYKYLHHKQSLILYYNKSSLQIPKSQTTPFAFTIRKQNNPIGENMMLETSNIRACWLFHHCIKLNFEYY